MRERLKVCVARRHLWKDAGKNGIVLAMEKRIVIVGGGFVGLRVARLVAKRLRNMAKVVLIDRQERFVFSPWLIDGLAGDMELVEYSEAYEAVATRDRFSFIHAEGKSIDCKTKTVTVVKADGTSEPVGYDLLVVCPGARSAYYGIPGAEQTTQPMKTLKDVVQIHQQLRSLILQARTATVEERKRLLHFMVVGGGPTGIEAMFAMKQYLTDQVCSDAPALLKELRFTLVESTSALLNGFPASMSAGTKHELEREGITVRTDMHATSMDHGRIITKDETLSGGFILWCAGVQPNDLSFVPDVSRDPKQNMQADGDLGLCQDVFGAGDAVQCIGANGKPAPRTAQIAMQEATVLAENIVRHLHGEKPKPCQPELLISIITLGDTGYINTPWFAVKTKLALPLRRFFYRIRFHQMTGR